MVYEREQRFNRHAAREVVKGLRDAFVSTGRLAFLHSPDLSNIHAGRNESRRDGPRHTPRSATENIRRE